MTFRERIADWISGGVVTRVRAANEAAVMVQRNCRIERANALDMEDRMRQRVGVMMWHLTSIEAATRHVKSGTGRKINRMAREALGE
ncbi:hypothetical protein [Mameliella alba]|uniref:hypothetical protein n=1 Tax=Mameliella alba TaxID=561184 RepID=UPI000B536063|nr:hypothetical protein [Mameliella alba]OWV44238.1 hypothetical protein CDZ95_06010 [Mameliella alba]